VILTETQRRVMNAVRAGADVWHPHGRRGRWVYVNPAEELAKPYCIQYRTLEALVEYGLLKESAKGDDPDHHYELVKGDRA
jgi:hypothetical protein